jgi:hypothetical protein
MGTVTLECKGSILGATMMFAIAAVASCILLATAFWAARPAPQPVRWGPFVAAAILLVVAPLGCQMIVTVAGVLAVLLGVSLAVWPRVRHRVRYTPIAIGCFVIAYGFACFMATGTMAHYDRLREQYPYVSIEDRLPAPRPDSRHAAPPGEPLTAFEADLTSRRGGSRTSSLRRLHENQVEQFISSPGFGVARVFPLELGLPYKPRDGQPEQPFPSRPTSATPAGELSPSAADELDLLTLHRKGTVDFVNPLGFGFVKDRRHVAGFVPHAFSEVPDSARRWRVERLDLIGLLLHPEPVAYVSEKLPAMDELRGAPTRPLDGFETAGLEAIRTGQTLHVGTDGNRARMVGAIRSAKQCVDCHGGQRGDLLGAFSYTLGSK